MRARLTITFSDDVLRLLRSGKSITVVAGTGGGAAAKADGMARARTPRPGSLPARLIAWSEKRKRSFSTADVEKRFRLSRAHASMLLSRMAASSFPIQRKSRGVYAHRSV